MIAPAARDFPTPNRGTLAAGLNGDRGTAIKLRTDSLQDSKNRRSPAALASAFPDPTTRMPPRIHPLLLPIAVAALCASMSTMAWAQDGRGGGRGGRDGPPPRDRGMGPPSRGAQRDDGLSDSVRRIERSTRGQVLSAERMQSDGRDVNRIKVVDGRGRVRVYMDDPQQPPARTRGDDD